MENQLTILLIIAELLFSIAVGTSMFVAFVGNGERVCKYCKCSDGSHIVGGRYIYYCDADGCDQECTAYNRKLSERFRQYIGTPALEIKEAPEATATARQRAYERTRQHVSKQMTVSGRNITNVLRRKRRP